MDFILDTDPGLQIQELVQNAFAKKIPLKIFGSNTKSFYGNPVEGHPLCLASFEGVIDYEPSELVLTARAGTRLQDIETTLSKAGQMLAFEPSYFGKEATFGGTIACGLSGPRRPYAGSIRDSVLGVKCINGKGELLTFGGQVIKNVAGYDVSRLMVGSLGTLGVLLEISVKVIPKPEKEITLVCQHNAEDAIQFMNMLAGKPTPLSAAAHLDGFTYLRLSGDSAAVQASLDKISRDKSYLEQQDDNTLWQQIREQTHPFFDTELTLWRLSLAADASQLDIPGDCLIDWGGAQRWLKTDASSTQIRDAVAAVGGHATLFRQNNHHSENFSNKENEVYHPLSAALAETHQKLKKSFDPEFILNRNKFYNDID